MGTLCTPFPSPPLGEPNFPEALGVGKPKARTSFFKGDGAQQAGEHPARVLASGEDVSPGIQPHAASLLCEKEGLSPPQQEGTHCHMYPHLRHLQV